jgi:site-specific recombinase XerC
MGKLKPRNEAQRKKALGINRLPKKGKEWRSLKPPDKKIAAATVEAWLEKRKRSLRYRPPSGKERAAVFLAQCGVKISERTAQGLARGKKAIVARWSQCRRTMMARRSAKYWAEVHGKPYEECLEG